MVMVATMLPLQWRRRPQSRPQADHLGPSLCLVASGKSASLEEEPFFVESSILQSQNSTTKHLEEDCIAFTLTSGKSF